MADVSQVVQMQRLRSYAARRPVKNDKSITHLYQHQVTSSGIAEFLPNSKTKNTDGRTIKAYYYSPGIQAKPKIPPRNTSGFSASSTLSAPSPINVIDFAGMTFQSGAIYTIDVVNISTIPTITRISFINIDPSIFALAKIGIENINLTSSDTVSFSNPTYNPTAVFTSGQITFLVPSVVNGTASITTSTILTITSTNSLDSFRMSIG